MARIISLDQADTALIAAATVTRGDLIVLPTDTVYGIAARWDSAAGVRRLFSAKGRPPEQPVQVLFSSVRAIAKALPDLDPAAVRVLDALLPGPFGRLLLAWPGDPTKVCHITLAHLILASSKVKPPS